LCLLVYSDGASVVHPATICSVCSSALQHILHLLSIGCFMMFCWDSAYRVFYYYYYYYYSALAAAVLQIWWQLILMLAVAGNVIQLTPVISSCYSKLKEEAIHASTFPQCRSVYFLWLQSISLTMYLQNSMTFILWQLPLSMGMPDCHHPPLVFDTGDLQTANMGLWPLLGACKPLTHYSTLPWLFDVFQYYVLQWMIMIWIFPLVFQFLINILSFTNILTEKKRLITVSFTDIVSL
jgi:hypothetical protein